MRRWTMVGVLLLAAAQARAASFDPALVAAATKEGTVVWYSGLVVAQLLRPMTDAFEARFPGIKLQYARASNTDTTVKLLNEARAHRMQADVADVTSGNFALTDAGIFAPYRPAAARHYPDALKHKDGLWTASNLYFLGVAYNTNLVKPEEAPKTLADLLDPRWKGHMAWTAELAAQGPPGFVFNVLTTMGEEKGRAYLLRLAVQQPVSVAVSPRAVLDQVIAGEHWMGLMMYNHNAAASIGAGAPLANARVESLVALFNIIGVIEGSPHPNAGKLLVEYILSDEGQQVMQRQDYLPADPNIPARIPELKPDGGHFAVTALTPEIAKEGLAKWISVYREVFR